MLVIVYFKIIYRFVCSIGEYLAVGKFVFVLIVVLIHRNGWKVPLSSTDLPFFAFRFRINAETVYLNVHTVESFGWGISPLPASAIARYG
jgi:hypothetical protein